MFGINRNTIILELKNKFKMFFIVLLSASFLAHCTHYQFENNLVFNPNFEPVQRHKNNLYGPDQVPGWKVTPPQKIQLFQKSKFPPYDSHSQQLGYVIDFMQNRSLTTQIQLQANFTYEFSVQILISGTFADEQNYHFDIGICGRKFRISIDQQTQQYDVFRRILTAQKGLCEIIFFQTIQNRLDNEQVLVTGVSFMVYFEIDVFENDDFSLPTLKNAKWTFTGLQCPHWKAVGSFSLVKAPLYNEKFKMNTQALLIGENEKRAVLSQKMRVKAFGDFILCFDWSQTANKFHEGKAEVRWNNLPLFDFLPHKKRLEIHHYCFKVMLNKKFPNLLQIISSGFHPKENGGYLFTNIEIAAYDALEDHFSKLMRTLDDIDKWNEAKAVQL